MSKGYILVFTSTSAFLAEDLLSKLHGIFLNLVPSPREFSSDCGVSLYFEYDNIQELLSLLFQNFIEFEIKLLVD